MRIPGIKYFSYLNIGRFFLQGTEVTASAAQLNAAVAGAAPTAAAVPIVDAGGRYTGAEVEAALQEIAGAGRTVETVRSVHVLADAAYVLPGAGVPLLDLAAAVQASLGLADSSLQPGADVNITNATPVNAAAADEVLEITGVVTDGEDVTIGADVYEFAADAAQTVGAGNIAVDITAATTASQGTLTVDTQPTAGDTMTIGTKVFTFVPVGTDNSDGEVSIGADLAGAKLAIAAAIMGTDGHNTAHPLVECGAFVVNALVLTALVGGVAGDGCATTETFFAGTNIFDAVNLGTTTPGVDCLAAAAATALAAVIGTGVEAVAGAVVAPATDDVTVTSTVLGVIGNAIALAEGLVNGNWTAAAVFLSGGTDGTVGTQWQINVDADWLYVCIAANTINDNNWRRIALGAAY